MLGSIFYDEPPPQQPRRFVPIPAQGQQPPRRTCAAMMSVVLASWPTGLEHQPQQRPLNVAPLRITYGQQPPRRTVALMTATVLASHPTGLEHQPQQRPLNVAPLRITYGQQPPRCTIALMTTAVLGSHPTGLEYQAPQRPITAPIPRQGDRPPPWSCAELMQNVLASWPTGLEYQPYQRSRWPQIPTPGDTPPSYNPAQYYALVDAWRPPDPAPWQRPLTVAPLTLVYGSQPPVTSATRDVDIYNSTLAVAWLPPDPLPQIPQRRFVAPLTLTYGQQPPKPRSAQPDSAWYADPWPQQAQECSAAIIPAAAVQSQPAFVAYPFAVIQSWQPEPVAQPAPRRIAPLTLAYGDRPPPYSFVNQHSAVRSWQPPDPMPQQQRRDFAPLSLVYGSQPPRGSLAGQHAILRAWEPPAPQPQRDAKSIAPLTLVYGSQPPRGSLANQHAILRTWAPADPQPQPARVWVPIAAPTPTAVPPAVYPWVVIQSWQYDPWPQQRPRQVAPLTLAYGQQPPRLSRVVAQSIIETWNVPVVPPAQGGAHTQIVSVDPPPPPTWANFRTIASAWATEFTLRQQAEMLPPVQTITGGLLLARRRVAA